MTNDNHGEINDIFRSSEKNTFKFLPDVEEEEIVDTREDFVSEQTPKVLFTRNPEDEATDFFFRKNDPRLFDNQNCGFQLFTSPMDKPQLIKQHLEDKPKIIKSFLQKRRYALKKTSKHNFKSATPSIN